jgi:hypothetical protein
MALRVGDTGIRHSDSSGTANGACLTCVTVERFGVSKQLHNVLSEAKTIVFAMKTVVLRFSGKLLEEHGRTQLFSFVPFAHPSEGWSVNILPVRSTVVALPRNEMEDHALFACDTGAATGAGRGF